MAFYSVFFRPTFFAGLAGKVVGPSSFLSSEISGNGVLTVRDERLLVVRTDELDISAKTPPEFS